MRLAHPRRPVRRLGLSAVTATLVLLTAAPASAAAAVDAAAAAAGGAAASGATPGGAAASGEAPGRAAAHEDAGDEGGSAQVTVDTEDCRSVDVTSTKDISNVVLAFEDGDTERFEDLAPSRTGTFAGVENAGETITTVWVKSGDNASGDGPGHGAAFPLDCADADAVQEPVVEGTGLDDPVDEDPEDATPRTTGPQGEGTSRAATTAGETPTETDEAGEDEPDTPPDPVTIADPLEEPTTEEGDEAPDVDEEAPTADEEPGPAGEEPDVLGAVETNDETAATDVAPEQLPAAGLDATTALLAALAAVALGGTLLRRSRVTT